MSKFTKRIFDIIISFTLLLILFPFFIVIAFLIKMTSKGPVFFLQDRPGKKGNIFRIYKFRTMVLGSETMIKGKEVLQGDSRVTSVGSFLRRFKIDELPQLFNILIGDMSLIGPRPERISSLADYNDETYKRLNMRPGLTGLAQCCGNIYLDLEDRYYYDIYYVENFGLLLDLRIIFRTIGVIIFGEKKYLSKPLVKRKKL